jgi:S-adenosylmethionine:tRNA ribosyltransferase-isomerase
LPERDQARLLVCDGTQKNFDHRHIIDLPEILRAGDVLVLNNSAVLPYRLLGTKSTGGEVEVLLLRNLEGRRWEAMVRGRRLQLPAVVSLPSPADQVIIHQRLTEKTWEVELPIEATEVPMWLSRVGQTPLPPYIDAQTMNEIERRERYQTVFADRPGSAAAPTAGLHLTHTILDQLRDRGVTIATVTLHIGLGTFAPITAEDPTEHIMHAEWGSVSPETAAVVNAATADGRRVIAVGTTALRTLEAFAHDGRLTAGEQWIDLFIRPGFQFQIVTGLLTNFHTPRSTLLMLVAALMGYDQMRTAYETAIAEKYRLFSFGDAMLIV